jgi:hypothetical protein
MAIPFKAKTAPKKPAFGARKDPAKKPAEELSEKEQGMIDRARREQERFVLYTDSEHWFATCFRTQGHLEEFIGAYLNPLGIEAGLRSYVNGHDLAEKLGLDLSTSPPGKASQFGMVEYRSEIAKDPLVDIEYTGDLEADSLAEFRALHAALVAKATERKESYLFATDSPYWYVTVFRDRPSKETFLRRAGIIRFGDKYVDGHRAAPQLGIQLRKE